MNGGKMDLCMNYECSELVEINKYQFAGNTKFEYSQLVEINKIQVAGNTNFL